MKAKHAKMITSSQEFREVKPAQGLTLPLVAHDLGALPRPHRLEFGGRRPCLGLGGDRLARLHGVEGLEHGGDLGALGLGDLGQRVAVEMHGAALVLRVGEDLGG